jgi:CheY-like chemotaxis protein
MLRKALEKEGYEFFEAADGSQGVSFYREHPTDLVLTDIFMPNQEGLETIMTLKRDFPNVKILAMSGGSVIESDTCLHMAKGLGAIRVYAKPFKIDSLLKDIGEFLNNGSTSVPVCE